MIIHLLVYVYTYRSKICRFGSTMWWIPSKLKKLKRSPTFLTPRSIRWKRRWFFGLRFLNRWQIRFDLVCSTQCIMTFVHCLSIWTDSKRCHVKQTMKGTSCYILVRLWCRKAFSRSIQFLVRCVMILNGFLIVCILIAAQTTWSNVDKTIVTFEKRTTNNEIPFVWFFWAFFYISFVN